MAKKNGQMRIQHLTASEIRIRYSGLRILRSESGSVRNSYGSVTQDVLEGCQDVSFYLSFFHSFFLSFLDLKKF
jgi:hypothetical protein